MKIRFLIPFLLCAAAFGQTGIYHSTGAHNGDACTADNSYADSGGYCAILKHIIYIIQENRSFDQYFGRFPGVTGGPVGTNSHPYNCAVNATTCPGGTPLPAYAGNPTIGDTDCAHGHWSSVIDINSGAMNKFNIGCGGNSASWRVGYGSVCSDYLTSGTPQVCASDSDCTGGGATCTANSLGTSSNPGYWQLAQSYGLADHFFSSQLGPSTPNHMYIWTASSNEIAENSNALAGSTGTGADCDAKHYGRCSNAANTLCSTSGDCSGGGTCTIDQATGFGYWNSATSCTSNADLAFNLTNIVGSAGVATFHCATNCGALPVGRYVTVAGNSISGFNSPPDGTAYLVLSVTGSPVTSFTAASSTTGTGTGGTASYDFCSNGNVYAANNHVAIGVDLLGGESGTSGNNAFVSGTCVNDNTKACRCATTMQTETVTSPCTDIESPSQCSGSTNNCDPTRNISATRASVCSSAVSIGDRLDAGSVSWKFYGENNLYNLWESPAYVSQIRYGSDWASKVVITANQFQTDAAACTSDSSCSLPAVSWVQSGTEVTNEHPNGSLANGMGWSMPKVNAIMGSTYLWRHSVIFITWDDFGGFYDHLAPTTDAQLQSYGPRVPLICVGAYCKNAVNTTTFGFESLLKCAEVQYGLPALNARDAAANDICTSSGGMIDLTLANAPLGSSTIGASAMTKKTVIKQGTVMQ